MKKALYLITVLFSFTINSQTSLDYYFNGDLNFDPKIPKPSEVIGHEVGEWHITHDKLVEYMYKIADKSDRIKIHETGKTYEDRPLIILTVSSPENLKNIEEIRKNHLRLSSGEKIVNYNDMPAIVYQGFSVHGNEPSGSNASLLGIYYLAAS